MFIACTAFASRTSLLKKEKRPYAQFADIVGQHVSRQKESCYIELEETREVAITFCLSFQVTQICERTYPYQFSTS